MYKNDILNSVIKFEYQMETIDKDQLDDSQRNDQLKIKKPKTRKQKLIKFFAFVIVMSCIALYGESSREISRSAYDMGNHIGNNDKITLALMLICTVAFYLRRTK